MDTIRNLIEQELILPQDTIALIVVQKPSGSPVVIEPGLVGGTYVIQKHEAIIVVEIEGYIRIEFAGEMPHERLNRWLRSIQENAYDLAKRIKREVAEKMDRRDLLIPLYMVSQRMLDFDEDDHAEIINNKESVIAGLSVPDMMIILILNGGESNRAEYQLLLKDADFASRQWMTGLAKAFPDIFGTKS